MLFDVGEASIFEPAGHVWDLVKLQTHSCGDIVKSPLYHVKDRSIRDAEQCVDRERATYLPDGALTVLRECAVVAMEMRSDLRDLDTTAGFEMPARN